MKNILFVVHSLHRGGAENQLKHLISAINSSKGYKANLVVFTNRIFFDIEEFKGLDRFEIINPLRKPYKFLRHSLQYDYIISFMFNASIVTTMLLYLRRRSNHFLSVRVDRIPRKYYVLWKILCSDKPQIFNSHIAKANFIRKGLSIGKKSHLLNNILVTQNDKAVTEDKSAISVIAHWRPQKDHGTVLRALDCLNIGRKVSFYGELLETSNYDDLINQLRSDSKIEVKGVKSDLREVYANSEIVILPTFYEGTPNVVLEALANGCKILTSEIEINKFLAENYSDVYLYEAGNVDSFIKNFQACIDSVSAGGNKNKLIQHYHKDSVLAQLKNILGD